MKGRIDTELAFMMVKPDGVQRRLVGEVLRRIEQVKVELVALRALTPSAKIAAAHYRSKCNGSSGLTSAQAVAYLTSGPVVISVWRGKNAVSRIRRVVGSQTNPRSCRRGTIRRDFAADSLSSARRAHRAVRNVVHSSNNPESAKTEIRLWFGKNWGDMYVQA